MKNFLFVEVLGKGDLVNFGLILEVFTEDDLIDGCTVFWLTLQALLDDHIEVFRYTLGNRVVSLVADFLLQLFDVVGVVGVLVRAHFI